MKPPLNCVVPCQSYEEKLEYNKQYRHEHREEIKEKRKDYDKEYYQRNKERINEICTLYKIKNKEIITKKFECSCGGRYTHKNKPKHFRTALHMKHEDSKNN